MMFRFFLIVSGILLHLLSSCSLQTTVAMQSFPANDCPAPDACQCGNNAIVCTGQSLKEVPTFSKSNEVWDIYLGGNRIKHITDGAFKNLKISFLDIRNNSLESISDLAFLGQETTLKSLHIENNQLQGIPSAVKSLQNLTSLFIQENPITSFNETILRTIGRTLYTFHFGSKEMAMWPASIHFLSVYELGVYSLPLEQLPESAFEGLESTLNWLVMTSMRLQRLPSSFQNLSSLFYLSLNSDEELRPEGIPDEFFKDFQKLDWLQIINIKLNKLPDIFHYATALFQFELNSVPISDFPAYMLPEHSNISIATFSDTLLKTVPSAIAKMKELSVLTLNYNNITTLRSDDIAGLTKLNYISLSNCPLKNISLDAFRNLDSLEYIALDNTALDTIPRAIEGIKFDIISLSGAPLVCTCDTMGWMKNWPDASKIGINGKCRNLNNTDVYTYIRQHIPNCPT